MSRIVLILVALVVGLLLDVLSNWLYDLAKQKGLLPDKPTTKRVLLIIIFFLPIVALTVWSEIALEDEQNLSVKELTAAGAFVEIESISPSPEDFEFVTDAETPVVVIARYYLPSNAISPQVSLEYLASYQVGQSGSYHWNVIHTLPANAGTHRVRLAGVVKPPEASALAGESFQIGVVLNVLDEEAGHTLMVARDTIPFRLASRGQ